MEATHTPNSWSWIPVTWLLFYPIVTILVYVISVVPWNETFSVISLMEISAALAVITYRKLAGGGCGLRFRLCALVKGTIAGLVFVVLSFAADIVVWEATGVAVGWSPAGSGPLGLVPYSIWLVGAVVGGLAARVVEVRHSMGPVRQVTVSGFE